jgi:two-component system response regulator AtoC
MNSETLSTMQANVAMPPCVLVADDDPEIRQMVNISLQLEGYEVETADCGEQVLQKLRDKPRLSALVLDLLMPGIGGMETLRRIRVDNRRIPVLVLSGLAATDNVVEALRAGASDYLTKPFEQANLQRRVRQLLGEMAALPQSDAAGRKPLFGAWSPEMLRIERTVQQIAPTDVPVLIHGESGVGKEVVARAIHEASDRRNRPFVKVNCAALPTDLLESEMFGHERGAFTGAVSSKPGKFELAHGGTILLDEISEMAPSLQAKFLQVLQDYQFTRLGGRAPLHVDVRVVAATNANLEKAIAKGAFREDLYYRLNVFSIHVPPLRERLEEVAPLAQVFLQKYGARYSRPGMTLPGRLLAAMSQSDWPGNVRELENFVRRYLVLENPEAAIEELERAAHNRFHGAVRTRLESLQPSAGIPFTEHVSSLKRKTEAEGILQALNRTNWNRKEASHLLNISYKSLLYRMKVLNIRAE